MSIDDDGYHSAIKFRGKVYHGGFDEHDHEARDNHRHIDSIMTAMKEHGIHDEDKQNELIDNGHVKLGFYHPGKKHFKLDSKHISASSDPEMRKEERDAVDPRAKPRATPRHVESTDDNHHRNAFSNALDLASAYKPGYKHGPEQHKQAEDKARAYYEKKAPHLAHHAPEAAQKVSDYLHKYVLKKQEPLVLKKESKSFSPTRVKFFKD